MFASFVLVVLFSVVVNSQPCADAAVCPIALNLCNQLSLSNYSERCRCQVAALEANCPRCLQVTLTNAVSCLTWGTLSRVSLDSNYDFKTCSACSNPPGDSYFPSRCASAMINFVDRLLPFNRVTSLPSIPKACDVLGQFYDELGSCGFQGLDQASLKEYVCSNQDPRYALCECGGHGVSPLGLEVSAAIKRISSEITAFFASKANASLGTVSVDVARTYNCDDRLVHDFTGSYDGVALRDAYAEFLGIPARRIKVGIDVQDTKSPDGKCVSVVEFNIASGKRDALTSQQATIQFLNGASAFVLSQLVTFLLQ
jgi:hypothetical protein